MTYVNLPTDRFQAVLFDMDGVITKTADIHATAWKETFDRFLEKYTGGAAQPFDISTDYRRYVDGKHRSDGVTSFLESRGIELPPGSPDDPPGFDTVNALGNLKNRAFLEQLEHKGVEFFESTVALIESLKKHGIKVAVVTASKNGVSVLQSANLLHLFDAKVDGVDAGEQHLQGKPAPDTFIEAARRLGVDPVEAIVVEDAVSGVEAGRAGGFGMVIGVDRDNQCDALKQHGADVVVRDLSEVRIDAEVRPAVEAIPKAGVETAAGLEIDDPEKWTITYEGFDPVAEGQREAICALGNGYFTTRAAATESVDDGIHYPGTYLAGLYNRLVSTVDGAVLEHEDLVNLPNWLCLSFRINDGRWFDVNEVELLSYSQSLDLRQGILLKQVAFRDREGRETTVSERRFVHLRHFHLAGLEQTIIPKNWSGTLAVRSAIDGRITNNGVTRYRQLNKQHLEPVGRAAGKEALQLTMRTNQSRVEVSEAASTSINLNDQALATTSTFTAETSYVASETAIQVKEGDCIKVRKVAALYCSRDTAISEPAAAARDAVLQAPDFDSLIDEHAEEWLHMWQRFALRLDLHDHKHKVRPSLMLRLHSFHVLQTASRNSTDLDTGLPARGWTGEGYRGHIFWDDIYVFPFLNFRMPEITGSLLRYRYRRLNEARKLALQMGARGARFPWESASTGREETPQKYWDTHTKSWISEHTHLQIHVSAAIAYNVWQYYQVTASIEFLHAYGAELLLEIARFFGSYARYNPAKDHYEILGIVGPDEYHAGYPDQERLGIDNNTYTNVMAVWTLCRALELLDVLPEDHRREICERLDLYEDEINLWDIISRKMFLPLGDDGIIYQFEGYDKLEDFPWHHHGVIDTAKLTEVLRKQRGKLNQYKACKQADVLMLFYLFSNEELNDLFRRLGYTFHKDSLRRNVEYYMPQTADNSTLSRVAHAWVLSKMDRPHAWTLLESISKPASGETHAEASSPRSWDLFLEALGSDYFDIQGGTTREGIHLGAMAGSIDIVQRCYTGVVARDNILWLNPRLPDELRRLSTNMHYRNQTLSFDITHDTARVTVLYGRAEPIKVGFRGVVHQMSAGDCRSFDLRYEAGDTEG